MSRRKSPCAVWGAPYQQSRANSTLKPPCPGHSPHESLSSGEAEGTPPLTSSHAADDFPPFPCSLRLIGAALHGFLTPVERKGGMRLATIWNNHAAKNGRDASFAKRISSHLAAALVVFCLLQIFIVAKMGGSLVLHLGVIIAIGGFAVAARGLERRWQMIEHAGLSHSGLALRFRRDVLQLWGASLIGALLWIPVAIVYHALFG
jgi:hypothetical protein